jgi:hypothetical protein
MTEYIVHWVQINRGKSVVQAKSVEEAKRLAEEGKDEGFETQEDIMGQYPEWIIEEVTEEGEE